YSVGPGGRASVVVPIPTPRGQRNVVVPRVSADPVRFTEATLVIDLTSRQSASVVWHGVYLRHEERASKLAEKLPGDVKKLFSEYPPKSKKSAVALPDLPAGRAPGRRDVHLNAARDALVQALTALRGAVASGRESYLDK